MFGPFRITNPLSGGLLWKIPWRMSKFQKRRHRLRLRAVDNVVATVDAALAKKGQTLESLERWKAEMPTEAEMLPKDKYTMFDRKEKRYRKGIHSMFLNMRAIDVLDKWVLIDDLQNFPSGQGCHSVSTLRVIKTGEEGISRTACYSGDDHIFTTFTVSFAPSWTGKSSMQNQTLFACGLTQCYEKNSVEKLPVGGTTDGLAPWCKILEPTHLLRHTFHKAGKLEMLKKN